MSWEVILWEGVVRNKKGGVAVPSSSVAIERVCDTPSNMGPPYCTTQEARARRAAELVPAGKKIRRG